MAGTCHIISGGYINNIERSLFLIMNKVVARACPHEVSKHCEQRRQDAFVGNQWGYVTQVKVAITTQHNTTPMMLFCFFGLTLKPFGWFTMVYSVEATHSNLLVFACLFFWMPIYNILTLQYLEGPTRLEDVI